MKVTMQALIKRINRKLAHQDEKLRVARAERVRFDLGDYYVIDVSRNFVISKHVDPEELGRELGVLTEFEKIVE